jgi:hypothetical protein
MSDEMRKSIEEIYTRFAKDVERPVDYKFFVHPETARLLRQFGRKDVEETRWVGSEVIETPHVESGKYYKLKTSTLKNRLSFPYQSAWIDAEINRFAREYLWRSVWGFGDSMRPLWMRRSGESFMAWGARLQREGFLDDLEVRTVYQNALWASIWAWVRGKVGR